MCIRDSYYRQVGLESFKMPLADFLEASRKPYQDVKDAFYYYLEHYNEGRPFILAGHSQGSAMLLELMRRESVSYTHLDVYKRQTKGSQCSICPLDVRVLLRRRVHVIAKIGQMPVEIRAVG